MTDFFSQSDKQRKEIIRQVVSKTGLFPQIIEKDLWITTLLHIVFSLPFSRSLIFKGGTSLSKIWNVIERFSEDIDLAIDKRLIGFDGDLTIRQLKQLRKNSSIFVKETFLSVLQDAINQYNIKHLCSIEVESNGEGDKTYPEPRKIFIRYKSLFDTMSYLSSEIVLEIGARSLTEPASSHKINSIISEQSSIETTLVQSDIIAALPEKTFLEKAFLLHEIFTGKGGMTADRRSRHLYDLEKMMDEKFAVNAINDNALWDAIHRHREVFTRIGGVDYSGDIRKKICLIPPIHIVNNWKQDYETMQQTMIYGASLPFNKLLSRIEELQERFHS
jgi:hypothetical protein